MRKQQPGMPPYPGQHPSSNEMQLWQQHLMYKQLQELQRQQQLQQLDQGARQQNLHSQAASSQAVASQLPSLLNGMPINNTSSYVVPNDIMSGESKTPRSPQMFTTNNTNWAQVRGSPGMHGSTGVMSTNDHGQAMRQVGFVSQQPDQSLYGTPVSRSLLNQHTQFQGLSNNFSDVMAKAVRDQLEHESMHSVQSNSFQKDQCGLEQASLQDGLSVAAQGSHGKSFFLNASMQSSRGGTASGNFQQVNLPQHSIQAQVIPNGQEQASWSSNLEEKAATQVGPSRGMTSLDPTEEKILFGTDDDGSWGASFGTIMGTGESFESSDQFGAFPSLHSGSWSALMQEAVQASTSDKGFQEEWSGLSFQKAEPPIRNPSALHNDNAKHQATWDNNSNNFQCVSSSSLRSSALFNDANSGPPFSTAPSFLHSSATVYEENNKVQTDTSRESFAQSPKEEQNMHLNQVHKQKLILDSGLQAQIQSNDIHGIWSKRMYEESTKLADSTNMEFSLQNRQGTWTHQQNMPLSNINRQPDTSLTGWNKSPTTHGGRSSEGVDNNRTLYAQNGGSLSSGMGPVKSDIGSSKIQSVAFSPSELTSVVNSNNLNENQEMQQHAVNRYQTDLGKHAVFDSFVKSRYKNVEEYKHQPSKAQQIQESSVNSTDPSPSMSDSQTSSGMSGWKTVGSCRFQPQSIENLGMNVEHVDSPKDIAYSQSLPKSIIQQLKNQEQGYVENAQFVGHGASNMGKGYSNDVQRSKGSPEESQYRSTIPRKTSQNMLELLQKVDDSKDNTTVACFGNSDLSTVHDTHEAGSADGPVSHSHHHQSSPFQGFGLRLGSPAQQVPNHDLQSQTPLHNFNTSQLDSGAGDNARMQSASSDSDHSQNRAHEASRKENLECRSDFSQEKRKEMFPLIAQGNSPSVTSSNLFYMGRPLQLQKQQQLLQQQQHFLRQRQLQLQKQQLLQQQQASLPTMGGRILPFRLDSPADAQGSGSQINSPGIRHSQPTNSGLYHLNSAQQRLLGKTGPTLQACARSGMLQQSAFSSMLHNVLTNTSVQQVMSGGQPQKLNPCLPLSASSRDKNSEAMQMEDDQGNKGGSVPSEVGICSFNTQQFTGADKNQVEENSFQGTDSERGDGTPKRGSDSEEQELVCNHHSDRDSAVSTSSLGHLPHFDPNRVKQRLNVAASNNDVGLYGRTVLTSNIQQPNYSLLQQYQAMKNADSDASKRDGKRLRGEFGPDASHSEWRACQGYSYGQNAVSRVPQADELCASSQSAFHSDVKMLSFSSRENEGLNAEKTAQLAAREGLSQNMCLPGQLDLQTQSQPLTSPSHLIGRNENSLVTPQMAHSLFEQYRKYKNGQILAMYADRQSAKAASQQFLPAEVSARIKNTTSVEQRIETSPFAAVSQIMSTSCRTANESSHQLPIAITGHDVVIRSKKRKIAISEFQPWHRVVSPGVQRLQSISMSEHDWAQAANRLTEKVEEAAEMIEDGPLVPRARRRLILTTQLMQQLLPSIPAPILAAEVTSGHESVTYFLAKSALGDACSLISCSGSHSGQYLNNENRTSEKLMTSKKADEVFFSKVVEDFIGRSRKLETEFSRLDRRTLLLDVRLEWQEVERFSLINRLGKFHGRSQADGADNSSTSQTAPRKIFPQRYVTAFSVPGNVPEGVLCLSL